MVIESKMPGVALDCIEKSSINQLEKEFGVIIVRGFGEINSKAEFLDCGNYQPHTEELDAEKKEVVLDESFLKQKILFGRSFQEEDLVYSSKYTMVQSRNELYNKLDSKRELCSLPEYLRKNRLRTPSAP